MKKMMMAAVVMTLAIFLGTFGAYAMNTTVINLGDTTIEHPQLGHTDPMDEILLDWFAAKGITNENGTAIDLIANQSQAELFHTDTDRTYEIEYLGLAYASYHSPFGVFTYDGNPFAPIDKTKLTFQDPLFVQNSAPPDSKYTFTIAANTYFGFYLNSNGSGTNLTTMVAYNPMPSASSGVENKDDYVNGFDHAIMYRTNKGYTMAFEDIVGAGDADWEDLIVNFKPVDGPDIAPETPEPATLILLGFGLAGMAALGRKKSNVKS